jgi:hypothetical protein
MAQALRRLASRVDERALRGLMPALVALTLTPFLVAEVILELKEPLFSDQLVFQYTAWCIRHGMRLYRDVGMADGPFIHYLDAAIQVFAGISDRGFRKADLVLQLVGSGCMGALVAPSDHPKAWARRVHGAAWAGLGATLWLSWYFLFGWDGTTQREAFYGLFGSTGLALLYAGGRGDARRARICTFVGALFAMSQAFGKPTGVMYPAAGLLSVLLPNAGASLDVRGRSRAFFAGCAACVLGVALLLLISGSVTGYFHWCWRIPYVGNRFLFRNDWLNYVLSTYWERFARMAAFSLIGGLGAIAVGLLPLRALGIILTVPIAYLGACLQGRGYNYHMMPAVGGACLLLVLLVARTWGDRAESESAGHKVVPLLALLFAGYYGFANIQDPRSFHWVGDSRKRAAPEHQSADQEKEVGRYLAEHTAPDDWVFVYDSEYNGHVVLLTAQRRTASPYLHAYVLNPVGLLPKSQVQPDEAGLAALTRLQNDDRKEACDGVSSHPPAAMALTSVDAAAEICPPVRAMLARDFGPPTPVNAYQVFLRKKP